MGVKSFYLNQFQDQFNCIHFYQFNCIDGFRPICRIIFILKYPKFTVILTVVLIQGAKEYINFFFYKFKLPLQNGAKVSDLSKFSSKNS